MAWLGSKLNSEKLAILDEVDNIDNLSSKNFQLLSRSVCRSVANSNVEQKKMKPK